MELDDQRPITEAAETPDQIIDAAMARAHPGRFIAQLVAATPLPYVLVGDSLAEVQERLPPSLRRTERQPAHPPEVVEICFAG